MALTINTWSGFSKKFNSTKRPDPNAATAHTATLKDQTGIKSPTFLMKTTDLSINYVQAFGNYYWCDVKRISIINPSPTLKAKGTAPSILCSFWDRAPFHRLGRPDSPCWCSAPARCACIVQRYSTACRFRFWNSRFDRFRSASAFVPGSAVCFFSVLSVCS